MKKIFLIFILTISFLLTGCSSSTLSKISINDVKEKMNKKESFIVFFTSNDNNSLGKTLESALSEYNLQGYKVDINQIADEDKNDFKILIDYSDPSIVFIVNGIDSSILSHVTDANTTKKDIINRLSDMNFIQNNS